MDRVQEINYKIDDLFWNYKEIKKSEKIAAKFKKIVEMDIEEGYKNYAKEEELVGYS